jgi:hypothetical protein
VERQNSSGAKHRSSTTTKLNGRSCLHCAHRRRGLHPGYKLLCRLLRRTVAWTFTDTQSRSNLLGLWRLQEVLEVTVFREDIIERLIDNIVRGCFNFVQCDRKSPTFGSENKGVRSEISALTAQSFRLLALLQLRSFGLLCRIAVARQLRSGNLLIYSLELAITPPLSVPQSSVSAPVPQTESDSESSPFSDLLYLLHFSQPAEQHHAQSGSFLRPRIG